jgi:hypothetical protein
MSFAADSDSDTEFEFEWQIITNLVSSPASQPT